MPMTPPTAPAPSPAARKPRETPVHLVRITAKPGAEPVVRLVQGSEAAAREHVAASIMTVERATPAQLIEHGRAGIDIEQAASGEGGAA